MNLWFDESGKRVGMSDMDNLSFSFETTKIEVSSVEEGKTCQLIDGEIVYSDPVETVEDTQAMNTMRIQKDRRSAYPSIEDQLDKIFHEGIDAWKTDIQAIKNAHPKPE